MEDEKPAPEGSPAEAGGLPTWFRLPGKATWHARAHGEYGVLWSRCGLRVVAAQAETREGPGGEENLCTVCAGAKPDRR